MATGLTAIQLLQKTYDNALEKEYKPGKKLKQRKLKMLKAYCKRLAGKCIVIGNSVFQFDKEGNTAITANGHNHVDFSYLLKMHGMEDRCDETLKAKAKAEEAKKLLESLTLTAPESPPTPVAETGFDAYLAERVQEPEFNVEFNKVRDEIYAERTGLGNSEFITLGRTETLIKEISEPTKKDNIEEETTLAAEAIVASDESTESAKDAGKVSSGTKKTKGRPKKRLDKKE